MWIKQDKTKQRKQTIKNGRQRQQKTLKESKSKILKEVRIVLYDIAHTLPLHQRLLLENKKKKVEELYNKRCTRSCSKILRNLNINEKEEVVSTKSIKRRSSLRSIGETEKKKFKTVESGLNGKDKEPKEIQKVPSTSEDSKSFTQDTATEKLETTITLPKNYNRLFEKEYIPSWFVNNITNKCCNLWKQLMICSLYTTVIRQEKLHRKILQRNMKSQISRNQV